ERAGGARRRPGRGAHRPRLDEDGPVVHGGRGRPAPPPARQRPARRRPRGRAGAPRRARLAVGVARLAGATCGELRPRPGRGALARGRHGAGRRPRRRPAVDL
ncbi:MAG: hypothetical protein AVDCRST_MAG20-2511, partial [uncultured Acidimicrobiales bacterium]